MTRAVLFLTSMIALLALGRVDEDASTRGTTSSYSCCVNGDFYACPSQNDAILCLKRQPNSCQRDASRDAQCLPDGE